jgi:protein TonB
MKSRIIILSLLLLLHAAIVTAQKQDDENPVFVLVDEIEIKPCFNGGSAIEFQKWVDVHHRYPRKAREAGIEGSVITQFTITKKGKLTTVRVFRGVHPLLDKEAIRVIKAAPQKWTPAKNSKGEPIDFKYFCPVIFKLVQ